MDFQHDFSITFGVIRVISPSTSAASFPEVDPSISSLFSNTPEAVSMRIYPSAVPSPQVPPVTTTKVTVPVAPEVFPVTVSPTIISELPPSNGTEKTGVVSINTEDQTSGVFSIVAVIFAG